MEIADFKLTFKRDPLFGFWSWVATGPDDVKLIGPVLGACLAKEGAERDALRRLRLYCDQYELSGSELLGREMTREIDGDPAEVETLRAARRQADAMKP